jgi:hypothetical protein
MTAISGFLCILVTSRGILLVVLGLIVSSMSPILRSFRCFRLDLRLPRDYQLTCPCFWTPFWTHVLLSLVGNFVASLGFLCLANGPPNSDGNYTGALQILALLSAGAIAGFWGISYEKAERDETPFLNVISALFAFIFYALFFSISFYIGKDHHLQSTPSVSLLVPGIMFLLLEINAVIDIWDYRKLPPQGAP